MNVGAAVHAPPGRVVDVDDTTCQLDDAKVRELAQGGHRHAVDDRDRAAAALGASGLRRRLQVSSTCDHLRHTVLVERVVARPRRSRRTPDQPR